MGSRLGGQPRDRSSSTGFKCIDLKSIRLLSYGAYPIIKYDLNWLRQEIEYFERSPWCLFYFELRYKWGLASLIISEQVASQAFDAFHWNLLIIDGLELKTISGTCNCYHTLIKHWETNEVKWARSSNFWYVLIVQYHVASQLFYYKSRHHHCYQKKLIVCWRAKRLRGRLDLSSFRCADLAVVIKSTIPASLMEMRRNAEWSLYDNCCQSTDSSSLIKMPELQCDIAHGLHLHFHSLSLYRKCLYIWCEEERGEGIKDSSVFLQTL